MKKSNLISLLLALTLIILCFVPALVYMGRKGENYDIWFVGDSIIAGNPLGSIPGLVSERTGTKILNAGFGGMRMSTDSIRDNTNAYVTYNMVNISQGIKNNDLSFSRLNMQKDNETNLEYWEEHAKALADADVKFCKIVFIEFGTNDYFEAVPLDDEKDKYNVNTYGGALRTVLENVQAGMPDARIVLITIPYNSVKTNGPKLQEYVFKELEIASEYEVEVINNYELSGICEANYSDYLYDGVHPNEKGIEVLSEPIIDLINEMKED